ncbi:MAG: PEP-CTERM sorting domain-containing protein [Bryobacterales bacterium]|nr:PEP-CTERM sorting domain-containing protein [Bryobacterales bacterium]
MRFFQFVQASVLLAAATALPLAAVPITYTYAGTGSGTLGTQSFVDVPFTFTGIADTANIVPWVNAGGGPRNPHLSATITIAGLGTFAVTTPSHTWVAEGCCGGLGQDLGINWVDLDTPSLHSIGYGLATNLGPIVDNSPGAVHQFNGVQTSGGVLTFGSISSVTFTAVTAASDVPEPGTWTGVALGCLLLFMRRTQRRN